VTRVFRYEHARGRLPPFAQDVLLALAFGGLVWWHPEGALGALATALRVAIPMVLVWGVITLHFPTWVEIGDAHIAFGRYGRRHRFERDRIERVAVRRFVVRDRVLIRILPSPPWRGRYWLVSGLADFDQLVEMLAAWPAKSGG